MPRPNSPPPFPDSPGAWLACYRHRFANEEGSDISPEGLGRKLGHSGATIRRSEGGYHTPSKDALMAISQELRLSNDEADFL